MTSAIKNGTKAVEFIINQDGTEFSTLCHIYNENGKYKIQYDNGAYSLSNQIDLKPQKKIDNCDDYQYHQDWFIQGYLIGDDVDDEFFVSEYIKQMKNAYNNEINKHISNCKNKIFELENKLFII